MAIGLGPPGWGPRQRLPNVVSHLAGATAGGAIEAAAVGGLGVLLDLREVRVWVTGIAIILAMLAARRTTGIGRRAQVPRRWAKTMSTQRLFFVCGALLGSGVATLITH